MESKQISVLVGCPTSSLRDYCLLDYLQALKGLEYDKKTTKIDFMIVDNSETDVYLKKIIDESGRLGLRIKAIKDRYVEHARERIINSRNILRQTAIDEGYDYFLSLEQDVIPPKGIIPRILKDIDELEAKNHKKPKAITGIYCIYKDLFGDGDKLYPLILKDKRTASSPRDQLLVRFYTMEEFKSMSGVVKVAGCGLGCVMIDTALLRKISFRFDKNSPSFDDMFFNKDVMLAGEEIYADTSIVCRHLLQGRKENQKWENIKK